MNRVARHMAGDATLSGLGREEPSSMADGPGQSVRTIFTGWEPNDAGRQG